MSARLLVVKLLAFLWIVGTVYLGLTVLVRTSVDETYRFEHLAGGEHHERHVIAGRDDPVLHRKQMLQKAKEAHLGGREAMARPTAGGRPMTGPLTGPGPGSAAAVVGQDELDGWALYRQYQAKGTRIWPQPTNENDDRIVNQINIIHEDKAGKKLKRILMAAGLHSDMQPGQSRFIDHGCPVNQCSLSGKSDDAAIADLILFDGAVWRPPGARRRHQIWVLFMLESPYHTSDLSAYNGEVNWTATYRTDSTLVAPYEHFTYFKNYTGQLPDKPPEDFYAGKTKQVAWFVSNCGPPSGRQAYVNELKKYIDVDIYGACGEKQCPRGNDEQGKDKCCNMLRSEYKFYLSFENSNCKDYITEKVFWRALNCGIIPVVYGAPRADYELLLPPGSYIHVDDFESPKALAAHLLELSADPVRYNSFFRWRGFGSTIDTKFWCRLCAMLHEAHRTGHHMVYDRLNDWWRGPGVCTDPVPGGPGWATWRNASLTFPYNTSFFHEWTEPF